MTSAQSESRLTQQLRVLGSIAIRLGVPIAAIFVTVYFVAQASGVPFSDLSRDPAETYSYPWYGGVISHVGVLIATAGSVTGFLISQLSSRLGEREVAGFAKWLAFGLLAFGLDDLMLLHESVLPGHGVPEPLVLVLYPTGMAWLLWRFREVILSRTDFILLGTALLLMAFQGILDRDLPLPVSRSLLEDPAKITALLLMLVYLLGLFGSQLPQGTGEVGNSGAAAEQVS